MVREEITFILSICDFSSCSFCSSQSSLVLTGVMPCWDPNRCNIYYHKDNITCQTLKKHQVIDYIGSKIFSLKFWKISLWFFCVPNKDWVIFLKIFLANIFSNSSFLKILKNGPIDLLRGCPNQYVRAKMSIFPHQAKLLSSTFLINLLT